MKTDLERLPNFFINPLVVQINYIPAKYSKNALQAHYIWECEFTHNGPGCHPVTLGAP